MKTRFLWIPCLFLALAPAACGDDDGSGDTGDSQVDAAAGGNADAAVASDFETLIMAEWTLPPPGGPNPDVYKCAALTMTEDVVISGFRAIAPNGTHHTVLSVGEPEGPDGQFDCGVGSIRQSMLFASGVGTDDFTFPEGVGYRVQAGQQLLLNLHLFNATDDDLSGLSGVAVKPVDSVEFEAEFSFAGPLDFNIPASGEEEKVEHTCYLAQDGTILNWWPHMHQLGTHMKVAVNGEVRVDENYSFYEQVNYPTNLAVTAGDRIDVTCSYVNDTGADVGFGDSSNAEMCFAGFYRYPKVGEYYCL